jgi:hypothetical protein
MALALGCLVMAIRAALKDEEEAPVAGRKRRMIALGGMIVCGFGFLGFAAAYFWPTSSIVREPQRASAEHANSDRVEPRSEAFPSVQLVIDHEGDDGTNFRLLMRNTGSTTLRILRMAYSAGGVQ